MAHSNVVLEIEHGPIHAPATSLREGWAVLVALMLAILVVTIDNTVLNVALPSISADLHAGTSQLQWIVNAYSLLFGGLLLTGGSLADRLGRRRVLLAGLAAFAGASALVLVVSSAPGRADREWSRCSGAVARRKPPPLPRQALAAASQLI
jgi:MFS family permease